MSGLKNSQYFKLGLVDGIPIALGYLAVSFSLGIQAKQAGIDALSATLMSLLCVTSAGQFAGIGIIADGGSVYSLALSQVIINLRYMLMSCSLSQKIDNKKPFAHRFLVAFGVTDEIFGISIAVKDKLSPYYSYGAMAVAIPGWCMGTCLGVIFGNLLPSVVVNSLGVALYGMFIAIIIPPAKERMSVAVAVIVSMLASYVSSFIPGLKNLENGLKIIILTIVISAIFAVVCPVREEGEHE